MLLLPWIKHFKYFIYPRCYYSNELNILNILYIVDRCGEMDILWVCGWVEIRNQF